MPGPTDLFTQADEILQACIAALDTIPLDDPTLDGAPDRAFISPSFGPIECCPGGGQLTVHVDLTQDAPAAPGLKMGRLQAGKVTHVVFVISIARCVRDSRQGTTSALEEPLRAEDQSATSRQTDSDVWALVNYLYALWQSGDLFTLCGEVFFEGARPIPQSGGCAGWTMVVRASLNGYQVIPAS